MCFDVFSTMFAMFFHCWRRRLVCVKTSGISSAWYKVFWPRCGLKCFRPCLMDLHLRTIGSLGNPFLELQRWVASHQRYTTENWWSFRHHESSLLHPMLHPTCTKHQIGFQVVPLSSWVASPFPSSWCMGLWGSSFTRRQGNSMGSLPNRREYQVCWWKKSPFSSFAGDVHFTSTAFCLDVHYVVLQMIPSGLVWIGLSIYISWQVWKRHIIYIYIYIIHIIYIYIHIYIYIS